MSTTSIFVSECLDAVFQQEASCCRTLSDLLTPTSGFNTLLSLDPFSSGSQDYFQFSHALCSYTFLDCLIKTGWSRLLIFTLPRSCHQNAGSLETDLVFSVLYIKMNYRNPAYGRPPITAELNFLIPRPGRFHSSGLYERGVLAEGQESVLAWAIKLMFSKQLCTAFTLRTWCYPAGRDWGPGLSKSQSSGAHHLFCQKRAFWSLVHCHP